MKFEPITKFDERNTLTSKEKKGDGIMSAHREVILIFPIYGQFVAIWKPGFARKVFNIHILINSNILSFKS